MLIRTGLAGVVLGPKPGALTPPADRTTAKASTVQAIPSSSFAPAVPAEPSGGLTRQVVLLAVGGSLLSCSLLTLALAVSAALDSQRAGRVPASSAGSAGFTSGVSGRLNASGTPAARAARIVA